MPKRHQRSTHRFGLERFDSFDVRIDVVCDGLKVLGELFGLVHDSLVFQDRSVVGKVDCRWLRRILSVEPLSICMPFAESLKRGDSLCVMEREESN